MFQNYSAQSPDSGLFPGTKTSWELWKETRDPLHSLKKLKDSQLMLINYRQDIQLLVSFRNDGDKIEDISLDEGEDDVKYEFHGYFFSLKDTQEEIYTSDSYFNLGNINIQDEPSDDDYGLDDRIIEHSGEIEDAERDADAAGIEESNSAPDKPMPLAIDDFVGKEASKKAFSEIINAIFHSSGSKFLRNN